MYKVAQKKCFTTRYTNNFSCAWLKLLYFQRLIEKSKFYTFLKSFSFSSFNLHMWEKHDELLLACECKFTVCDTCEKFKLANNKKKMMKFNQTISVAYTTTYSKNVHIESREYFLFCIFSVFFSLTGSNMCKTTLCFHSFVYELTKRSHRDDSLSSVMKRIF